MRLTRLTGRRDSPVLVAFAAVLLQVATPAFAQRPARPASSASREPAPPQGDGQRRPGAVLARADSAYAAGDRTLARTLYAQVLAADSTLSRAAFRLAQLETSPEKALALYRYYESLEPRDAWGFMAEGDLLGRMGRYRDAQATYARAALVAPDERDVVIGRSRLYLGAGRPDVAATELARWTERHPEDSEAWDLLGRAQLRSGRPRAAARAFTHAGAASGVPGAAEREAIAHALAAPAVEPIVGYQRDSDGNRTSRLGGVADAMVADGVRLGAGVERVNIGDGVVASNGVALHGRLAARPAPDVRLDLQGGALRMSSPLAAGAEWTTPQGDARVRWRAPVGGPALELRAQRLALGTAPALVANRVTRSEVRATAELPVRRVRLRGTARAGRVDALGEPANTRLGAEGALVLPLGEQVQLSGQYRWMGFEGASLTGYFAPRAAETIEGGIYFEVGEEGPVSLAADLGGGAQRVAEQGAGVGAWTRALRAWGYASVALGAARAAYAELEAYDAPFAPEGVATSGTWRFVSLSLGIRWGLW